MFEKVGISGSELEEVSLDKPIVLSSVKVSEAILGGENIWQQPNSP